MPILVIFLTITAVSLALTFVALSVQSSVRAYVGGEGIWSKAQRDAVFLLQRYGHTRNLEYLQKFEAAVAIPLGDRVARIELQKSSYDPAAATQGFIDGGNHPDDIPGLIMLFRCCAELSFFQPVVRLWTQGDAQMVALQNLAGILRTQVEAGAPAHEIQALLNQVESVNDTVRPLEAAFTAALGDVARWVTRLLFFVTSGILALLICLGAYVSTRILKGIRQSEEQFRMLLTTASDALIVVDRDNGTILEANQRAEQMVGRSVATLIGSRYVDYLPLPHEKLININRKADTVPVVTRQTISHVNGQQMSVEISYNNTVWGDRPAHLAILRDISESIRVERELRVAANAMSHMAEGVVITDARCRVVSINGAFSVITGYTQEEVMGTVPSYPASRHHDAAFSRSIWKTVRRTGNWQGEIWNRRKSGELYPVMLSISAVQDEGGHLTHYVGVFNDISTYKEYEQRLRHLAHHDTLTGLPNRTAFDDHCEKALNRAVRHGTQLALLFIDLDGFKAVNDTYGHAVGDMLLQAVAGRITACLRDKDIVARMGGDEFTVLLEDITGAESAILAARKLLAALSEKTPCGDREISVFASIGISLYPDDADDVETLLTHADIAMYEAKNHGRNNYQLFSPGMAVPASTHLTLTNGLKQALDQKQFELHYQPCVDVEGGHITSIEALLSGLTRRWARCRHPCSFLWPKRSASSV
ncbi:MAG: diguanylate cyclase [Burkholderiales bacterium]